MFVTACFVVVLSIFTAVGGTHWALLVAGSSGYGNYRHQADICHSYHIMHSHGIPDENIIVMMYDDIAFNVENPFQGNIVNWPGGKNLYPGVPKDYREEEVTPEVFLKVLTGDDAGVKKLLGREGKVIRSGPNDRIFVNFADHGAAGLLGFPDDVLYAKDLISAIKDMYQNKKYKEMVFYVEACESGSMFEKLLPDDMNVFAETAANSEESSYACCYDDERDTYVGDLYSVNWMRDSDKEDLGTETIQYQYKIVKQETNTSHVMEYGDMKLTRLPVGDFQGNLTARSQMLPSDLRPLLDVVRSEDAPLKTLQRRLMAASGDEKIRHSAALQKLILRRNATVEFFKNVVGMTVGEGLFHALRRGQPEFRDWDCYKESVQFLMATCPGMRLTQNDQAMRHLRVLANLCETVAPTARILATIGKAAYETRLCDAAPRGF